MGGNCCSDRKKKEEKKDEAFVLEEEPEWQEDPHLHQRAMCKDDEALNVQAQLHATVGGDGIIIGIIGEMEIANERTKAILEALGQQLATDLKGRACCLVCGFGEEGVQAAFTEAYSITNPLGVYNLQPHSEQQPFGSAQLMVAGKDQDHMLQLYCQIADIYITAEGGELVTEAVMSSAYWGAAIVPLISTGGASSGEHYFPAGNLQPPLCVSQDEWSILSDKEATPEAVATGVSKILSTMLEARNAVTEIHKKNAGKNWNLAATKTIKKKPMKMFCPRNAVTKEEAAVMEDLDFEAVLAAWKPKGQRSGGAVRGNVGDAGTLGSNNGNAPKEDEAPRGPPPSGPRIAAVAKIAAPPPPAQENPDAHAAELDDISQARKRMAAKLEEVHQKTDKASKKLQAVFRGRVARKVVADMKEAMKKSGADALKAPADLAGAAAPAPAPA